MELKEGMYVRHKRKGIFKITNDKIQEENKIPYICVSGNYTVIELRNIAKASYNIIDLIEEGDYVNDEKIVDIGYLTNGPEKGIKIIDYYIAPNTVYYLKNEDIKSIVTKEQFESMKYNVGEK